MGYIGQMPQARKELPGRATSTGEPGTPGQAGGPSLDHGGSRADELPSLLPNLRSVSLALPAQPDDGDVGD